MHMYVFKKSFLKVERVEAMCMEGRGNGGKDGSRKGG